MKLYRAIVVLNDDLYCRWTTTLEEGKTFCRQRIAAHSIDDIASAGVDRVTVPLTRDMLVDVLNHQDVKLELEAAWTWERTPPRTRVETLRI